MLSAAANGAISATLAASIGVKIAHTRRSRAIFGICNVASLASSRIGVAKTAEQSATNSISGTTDASLRVYWSMAM
jgi:hypothetical protein